MNSNTWSNWSGRQTSTPSEIHEPRSLDEFRLAVAAARSTRRPIRAIGASHSHSRVAATDGVLVRTDAWQGLIGVSRDPEQRSPIHDEALTTATFRSGTRIFQSGPLLFEHGRALRNQGDIDKQSLAGATATGTHGTGPSLQNLSAGITALELLTASGDVLTVSPDTDPELFQVARQSLGAVGLITQLTLATRPAYRLHERLWSESPERIFERIDELIAATRHFEFFWDPQRDRCAAKSLDETDRDPDAMPDHKLERIGWSHEIISSIRDERHTEMEYSIPAEHGPECFERIRAMVLDRFGDLTWPVEYRTLAADDGWISTTGGRPTVTISLHQDVNLDDRDLFEAAETIFRSYDGRPHWGKVHYLDGHDLEQLYPRYGRWWQVRDRLDPDGVFLTPDLERLRP